MTTTNQAVDIRIKYAIQIRGTLGEATLGAFPDLIPAFVAGDTVLVGSLPDQPALHGVLAQIEALSLELVEVRRLPFD